MSTDWAALHTRLSEISGHTPLAESLALLPGRCQHGYHASQRALCHDCWGTPVDEWAVFKAALKSAAAAGDDGLVHQRDVRPLVRGVLAPKHIGQCWKRARDERLVVERGHERSDDREGRNAGRMEPYYELRSDS